MTVGRKPLELTGKIFGRLKVLRFAGRNKSGNRLWLCVCKCGTTLKVLASNLSIGCSNSCGCLKRDKTIERNKLGATPGSTDKNKRELRSWMGMLGRCNNSRSRDWPSYGGRGIVVCERWKSFSNFFEDMGECPPNYTIERENNDGNYEPTNCIWASRKTQGRNKRNVPLYTYNGESKSLAEWAEITGIPWGTLRKRIYLNWSMKEVLTPGDNRVRGGRRWS